ncbi:MAG: type IV pilus modification PilV family protein [Phycisphaerales bacterium]
MMRHRTNAIARARRSRSAAGFTLIEVLLAAFVLALGVLGLTALFAGGARQQQLANEVTRATSLAEAALAERDRTGVMSSLDEDGSGIPDLEERIDIGRWYAIGTRLQPGNYFDGRLALVSRTPGGQVIRYGAGYPLNDPFQPFFRKVSDQPVVLYQRPAHWRPEFNPDRPMAEASPSAATTPSGYDPRNAPGSPFEFQPYSLYDSSPSTPSGQKVLGPAFLPDRAILPESVELSVTYFEYDKQFIPGQPYVIGDYDRFTTSDGDGETAPTGDRAAYLRGTTLPESSATRFRWVDPRSPSVLEAINDGREIPLDTLLGQNAIAQPLGAAGPAFPNERIWRVPAGPTASNLHYYAVYMPNAGAYTNLDPNTFALPQPNQIAERPAYLVMHLAPDLRNQDLDDPNPTIVAFELAGVLTDTLGTGPGGIGPIGPKRSVEQIRVDRYVSRVEKNTEARQRVVTVPDDTRPSGSRPVVAYSTLYRRTPDGNGELAVFGYRVSPTRGTGEFIPWEDIRSFGGLESQFADNGNSPLVSEQFEIAWDDDREQFYINLAAGNNGNQDAIIRQGNLILIAGPTTDDQDEAEIAYGADNAVRILNRVTVAGEIRGYLDQPPTFRGRPLGDLANDPPGTEQLMGWFVRDRVRAQPPLDPTAQSDASLYQLEALEVRVVPLREN